MGNDTLENGQGVLIKQFHDVIQDLFCEPDKPVVIEQFLAACKRADAVSADPCDGEGAGRGWGWLMSALIDLEAIKPPNHISPAFSQFTSEQVRREKLQRDYKSFERLIYYLLGDFYSADTVLLESLEPEIEGLEQLVRSAYAADDIVGIIPVTPAELVECQKRVESYPTGYRRWNKMFKNTWQIGHPRLRPLFIGEFRGPEYALLRALVGQSLLDDTTVIHLHIITGKWLNTKSYKRTQVWMRHNWPIDDEEVEGRGSLKKVLVREKRSSRP